MTNDDLTPMRRQYLDIKAQHPNAIVLFRLGDFYEAFDDDAVTISRELDLILTQRGGRDKAPMAGVPHHAIENYVAKLVERGFHVVIVDQMEPPGKKLVRREVTRVITPGTVVAPEMLDGRQNSYLLALAPEPDKSGSTWTRVGVAYVDITTGEFAATQLGDSSEQQATVAIVEELARLLPREVLIPARWTQQGITLPNGAFLTSQPDHRFEFNTAKRALLDHFEVSTLDGYGLGDKPLAVSAAGAIIQYLRDTQRNSIPQLTAISIYSTASYMVLDSNTRRNLELTETIRTGKTKGSLLGVLDETVTPMGSRLLRTWIGQPLLDIGRLRARHQAVGALFDAGLLRAQVIDALQPIYDLERLTNRVLSGHAGPRELLSLKASLDAVPALRQIVAEVEALRSLHERLDACSEVCDLIALGIEDEPPAVVGEKLGIIRSSYSPELDEIHNNTRDAKEWIANLESLERERSGIKSLKVGFNKVFGYYIEISHSNAEKAPADYIRKQ
ncbi:MAG: DNA mismatch repair protein MutS, partial [Anaerolineae bacterium]|nr:DNA mismatch repair protein MutS [Anaerolineae bacterium]